MTIKYVIYETDDFYIDVPRRPFVDRLEGGSIRLSPKVKISDRTKLSPELAKEYMKLSMIAGEAMTIALRRKGIDIGIVNYQEMGNWAVYESDGPWMHTWIFGRAKTAEKQKFGEAVIFPHFETGFYDDFQRLNDDDIAEIRKEIERLLNTDKYKNF